MKLGVRFWLISLGFNTYWTLAVLGREHWLPILFAGAVLALFFTKTWQRKWVILAAILGIAMDTAWYSLGVFSFTGEAGVPLWMCALWLTFSCWWYWLLGQFQISITIVALLGAISGPLSYILGWQLAAMTPQIAPTIMMLILSVGWAIYLPVISWPILSRRKP